MCHDYALCPRAYNRPGIESMLTDYSLNEQDEWMNEGMKCLRLWTLGGELFSLTTP